MNTLENNAGLHTPENVLESEYTLTSNNLIDKLKSGEIKQLPSGLYDFVALLGSTHEDANWCEESSLKALGDEQVMGYTPRMENWDPSHSKAEAEALNKAAVIGLRLENKNIKNGSVGSIVEWGFAILSAKLNGQRLIVSIEEGFENSLTDPAQKAQFEVFMGMMQDAEKSQGLKVQKIVDLDQFNAALVQARNEQLNPIAPKKSYDLEMEQFGDLNEFNAALVRAHNDQLDLQTAREPMTKEKLEEFYAKRRARLAKPNRTVTLGGSSGAMGSLAQPRFAAEQELLFRLFTEPNQVLALNQGEYKKAWDEAYQNQGTDHPEAVKLFKEAHETERKPKAEADILMWVIQNEAVSLAAVVEIGFLMTQAIQNGQLVAILLEDFDADAFVQNMLFDKAKVEGKYTGEQSNQALLLEIIAIYKQALEEEATTGIQAYDSTVIQNAIDIINRAQDPNLKPAVTFNEIKKNPLLKKSSLFTKADTARRARGIAKEQFLLLKERMKELTGETENEPFILATDFTDYMQRLDLIKNPESAEKRANYWEKFGAFKQQLELLQIEAKSGNFSGPELINAALNIVNPKEKRFVGLTDHLSEITGYTDTWANILAKKVNKNTNTPYMSERNMALLKDVISPLHDILKFLGGPDQQAMADHEILISYVIGKYFPDLGFSSEDVKFMAAVVGDHENIFKEKGREGFPKSSNEIDRGKSFFFVLDTLTNVVQEDKDGTLILNESELRKRFTDLYFRHIDPEKGKIYRPEWGKAAIGDFVAFFAELQENYDVKLAPDFIKTIVRIGALEAIQKAIDVNANRAEGAEKRLSDDQITELNKTADDLRDKFGLTA